MAAETKSVAAASPPVDLDAEIWNALEVDALNRFVGVTGDLFPLIDRPVPPLPITHMPSEGRYRFDGLTLPLVISWRYHMEYWEQREVLKRDDIDPDLTAILGDGLIAAGGAISRLLHQYESKGARLVRSDIDLFLVGLNVKQAKERVERLFSQLQSRYKRVLVYRTAYTVTFDVGKGTVDDPTSPIQVVLRLYNHISEVLHGFDNGAAAVAYDGKEVWTTTLGLLAHERGIIVLDLEMRRSTYEKRLIKYMEYGFHLCLPNLKSTWRTDSAVYGPGGFHNAGDLPLMTVDKSKKSDFINQQGVRLFATRFSFANIIREGVVPAWQSYDDYDAGVIAEVANPYTSNLIHAVEGKDGILTAKVERLIGAHSNGEDEKIIWEMGPAVWNDQQAVDALTKLARERQPYMKLLQQAVGGSLALELLSHVQHDATGKVTDDLISLDWKPYLEMFRKRTSALRQMRYPEFSTPVDGTRLTQVEGAIPLKPISESEWYGVWYQI